VTAFSTLTVLPAAQLANLNELGYLSMTPVQAAALPAILAGKMCACRQNRQRKNGRIWAGSAAAYRSVAL
jgi:superfamily II DNA/RNA helicase